MYTVHDKPTLIMCSLCLSLFLLLLMCRKLFPEYHLYRPIHHMHVSASYRFDVCLTVRQPIAFMYVDLCVEYVNVRLRSVRFFSFFLFLCVCYSFLSFSFENLFYSLPKRQTCRKYTRNQTTQPFISLTLLSNIFHLTQMRTHCVSVSVVVRLCTRLACHCRKC